MHGLSGLSVHRALPPKSAEFPGRGLGLFFHRPMKRVVPRGLLAVRPQRLDAPPEDALPVASSLTFSPSLPGRDQRNLVIY